jgi:hypothetical protein
MAFRLVVSRVLSVVHAGRSRTVTPIAAASYHTSSGFGFGGAGAATGAGSGFSRARAALRMAKPFGTLAGSVSYAPPFSSSAIQCFASK